MLTLNACKNLYSPVAQWWSVRFFARTTVVRFPVWPHIIMPLMLRSVTPLRATAEVHFCSQQARGTRLPATEHRFYGSRASLAKREWSALAPLRPGVILSSHILALFRRLKMSVLHVVLHAYLQMNASVFNTRDNCKSMYLPLWSSGRFIAYRAVDPGSVPGSAG